MPSPNRDPNRAISRTARIALVGYLLFVGFSVWMPARVSSRVTGLVGVVAGWVADAGIAEYRPAAVVLEVLANVALFVPIGLLLAVAWPRWGLWRIVLIGAALSIVIETGQSFLPSRFPTVSDVLANTTGTLLGAAVVVTLTRLVSGRRFTTDRPRLVS